MKTLYKNFKTQLVMAVVLFSASIGFAQTVTVPSNCRVVKTGTGGNFASAVGVLPVIPGRVGDGGIVAMPDALEVTPFTTNQGGTFTFNPPVATPAITTAAWKLLGDLSNTSTTPFYGTPTQPGNALTAIILSYNKFLRPSSTEALNPKWGRSKGQVRVSWSQPPCNNFITFDVFKTFTTSLPTIVGPSCIKPNTDYTYSVDRIVSDNPNDNIGFDSYYWQGIPASWVSGSGTNFYNSADNSSISFRTGATVSEFKLACYFGRVNPNTNDGGVSNINQVPATPVHTTGDAILIRVSPSAPQFTAVTNLSTLATLLNSQTACLATGLPSSATTPTFSLTYPNPAAGQIYTWSAQNSGWTWTTSAVGTTSTLLSVNTNNSNNPEQFTLTITGNNCDPVIINYQINRDFVAPLAITPTGATTTTGCIDSTSSGNTFTISPNAASNSIVWSIDPSTPLAGVTLQNTTATTVTVNATGANTGTFNLRAKSGVGACASIISLPISVKPVTPTISGANCIVQGSTAQQTYTCVATPGATYTWVFPAGWRATSFSTTTNSIIVTPASASAVLNGAITVTANGNATCNNTATLDINYQAVAPTGVTAGCFSVGIAGTGSVTITNGQSTGNYTATLIATIAGSTNVITSAVTTTLNTPSAGLTTLSFSTSALVTGTYNIVITHNSGCTITAATTTTLTIAGNGATISPSFGPTTDSYFAINSIPNAQFEWFVCDIPSGICTSVGSNNITLTLNGAILTATQQANRQICVNVFSSGSTCKTRVCIGSGTHARQANTVVKIEETEEVAIYPNPSRGAFTIKIVAVKEKATAIMYTNDGKKVREFSLVQGENKIERDGLVTGNYYIIIDLDGKNVMKQILIN